MSWTSFERRWRDALLAAMIPAEGGRPGISEVEQGAFWELYREAAPPVLRLGLRASVWALTWSAVPLAGRPFHRLSPEKKDRFLNRRAASRLYLVRQLVMTLKLVGCFLWLSDDDVRARVMKPAPNADKTDKTDRTDPTDRSDRTL